MPVQHDRGAPGRGAKRDARCRRNDRAAQRDQQFVRSAAQIDEFTPSVAQLLGGGDPSFGVDRIGTTREQRDRFGVAGWCGRVVTSGKDEQVCTLVNLSVGSIDTLGEGLGGVGFEVTAAQPDAVLFGEFGDRFGDRSEQ